MSDQQIKNSLMESGYISLDINEKGIETIYKKFADGNVFIYCFNAQQKIIGEMYLTAEQLETIYQSPTIPAK